MPGKKKPTAVAMIFREMTQQDRCLETIAEAAILALEVIEHRLAPVLVNHPIPLRATRDSLRESLSAEQTSGSTLGVRLAKLQLRLLETGKARHSTCDAEFEAFYSLLDQHRVDF